jgi:RimJ/RimL family protein N-acetyltransferase
LIVEPIPNSNRVIVANDERLFDWIASRIPHMSDERKGQAQVIAVGEDGKILAAMAVLGVNKRYRSAEVAIASEHPRWATRGALRVFLGYPFEQLGLQRITAISAASNNAAINFNTKLGFRVEGVIRRGYGDEDSIVMGMLREEAEKWLRHPVAPTNEIEYSSTHSMEANA